MRILELAWLPFGLFSGLFAYGLLQYKATVLRTVATVLITLLLAVSYPFLFAWVERPGIYTFLELAAGSIFVVIAPAVVGAFLAAMKRASRQDRSVLIQQTAVFEKDSQLRTLVGSCSHAQLAKASLGFVGSGFPLIQVPIDLIYLTHGRPADSHAAQSFLTTTAMVKEPGILTPKYIANIPDRSEGVYGWLGYEHLGAEAAAFVWQSAGQTLLIAFSDADGYQLQSVVPATVARRHGDYSSLLASLGVVWTEGVLPGLKEFLIDAEKEMKQRWQAQAEKKVIAPDWAKVFLWQRIKGARKWLSDELLKLVPSDYRQDFSTLRLNDGTCGHCGQNHTYVLEPVGIDWSSSPWSDYPGDWRSCTLLMRFEGNPHSGSSDKLTSIAELVMSGVLDAQTVQKLFAAAFEPLGILYKAAASRRDE